MTTVRKALAEDFEAVLPLLLHFNADAEKWKALFFNHWQHQEDYYGFVLTDGDRIVGFLGAIFSSREINGRKEKFCNLSTWIVDEHYKKHGLSLFLPVLELEDYTVTNFSSAEKTYIISKKLGFEDVEFNLQYVFPFPRFGFKDNIKLEYSLPRICQILHGPDLRIFEDHIKFDCHHILITRGEEYCYLILKKTKAYLKPVYYMNRIFQKVLKTSFIQENAFLGHVHYVSNKPLFKEVIAGAVFPVCAKLKVLGLLLNSSWLTGVDDVSIQPYKTFSSPLFKSKTIQKENIDTLYSEIFLINNQ
jgi:hypothetical protein